MVDALVQSLNKRVHFSKCIYLELQNLDKVENTFGDVNAQTTQCWKDYLDTLTTNQHRLNLLDSYINSATMDHVAAVETLAAKDNDLSSLVSQLINSTFTKPSMFSQHKQLDKTCNTLNTSTYSYTTKSNKYKNNNVSANYLGSDSICESSCNYDAPSYRSYHLNTHNTARDHSDPSLNNSYRTVSDIRVLPQRRTREFELPQPIVAVSNEEFLSVPLHIRSRLTLERITYAIEDIMLFLNTKYRILARRQSTLMRNSDLIERRKNFIAVETCESRGLFWFSQRDIRYFETGSFKLDSTGKSILNTLRYLNRLLTIPGGGPIRYSLAQHKNTMKM